MAIGEYILSYTAEDIDQKLTELDKLSNENDYSSYRLRNIAILTEVPTVMNDGDIALVIQQEA